MWQDNEQFFIGKDGQAHSLGIGYSQMSAYVEQQLSSKADLSALDFKRDTLDANFYQDPLASDDAGFKFSVSYAFSPEQELFNGILKKTDSEIPTWTWG